MPRPSEALQTVEPTGPVDPDQLFEVEIETGANAIGDEVWVYIEDLDGGKHRHGPVRWEPSVQEDGIYFPKVGQRGLAVRAKETGELWLSSWEATGEADAPFAAEVEGDKHYEHNQPVAAKEWVIKHDLEKEPNVTAFSVAGQQILFEQVPIDDNNLILKFNIDISGRAVLN